MKVYNLLPHFLSCIQKWETLPSKRAFETAYLEPIRSRIAPLLEDFQRYRGEMYEAALGLDWPAFRQESLLLDPKKEEKRLRQRMKEVERTLGIPLKGEAILFGAYTLMDGYARFHHGKHQVFLGVDESHGRGAYLDILIVHELTHVIRESRQSVWKGFGLNPKMSHDEFAEKQPVIEHLFSEGFSCAVSEILNPKEDPWHFAYQTEESLKEIYSHGRALDRAVHQAIRDRVGYRELYNPNTYIPPLPRFAHYVWAWQWARKLIRDQGNGDPKKLLSVSSIEFIENAVTFKLNDGT